MRSCFEERAWMGIPKTETMFPSASASSLSQVKSSKVGPLDVAGVPVFAVDSVVAVSAGAGSTVATGAGATSAGAGGMSTSTSGGDIIHVVESSVQTEVTMKSIDDPASFRPATST